jgi:4-hydroxybenzoate polyprenyltransferase
MDRWFIYIKERFQLIPQLIVVGGMTLIAKPREDSWQTVSWVFSSLLLFFFLLRAMDEYKDYDKDCVAHPERPLPQGVISRSEMKSLIHFLILGMFGFSVFLGTILSVVTGLMYLIVTVYLWAMFHEFYLKSFLSKRPVMNALSHQLIIVPLSAFLIAARGENPILSIDTLLISMLLFGGFFAYEICRKLDPQAHPILKTYPHTYGMVPTALLVGGAVLILSVCGYFLGMSRILWPIEFLLLVALINCCSRPAQFKAAEKISVINLLACIYSLAMRGWT